MSQSELIEPTYLGDGLYVSFDGWQLELYAFNGARKTNQVYLEPAVLVSFLKYVEWLKAQMAEHKPVVSAKQGEMIMVPWQSNEPT